MGELTYQSGIFYNEFGSIVYPRKKDRHKYLGYSKLENEKLKRVYKRVFSDSVRSYQEFEIHAVAYSKLRDFFQDDNIVRGEFSISVPSTNYAYLRCDIAILSETGQPTLIIEVKKNYKEVQTSTGQIEAYKKHALVYVLDNMKDAENIVQILIKKKLIIL